MLQTKKDDQDQMDMKHKICRSRKRLAQASAGSTEAAAGLIKGAASLAVSVLVAGCVTGTAGLGEEAGTASLPSGLTMLASNEAECGDSVHVGAGSLTEARLGPELFIRPGQNASFRVNEAPVNWACIDDDSREFHEFACSDEATYVRITRALDGGEMLLECFG